MDDAQTPNSLTRLLNHGLLSAEEESRLSLRIRRGSRVVTGNRKRQSVYTLLTRDARDAFDRLVSCNARLAFSEAVKFAHSKGDVEDFFSAGMVGVAKAAFRYDPLKKGVNNARFATFARWHVQREFRSHLNKNLLGAVALPIPAGKRLGMIRQAQVTFRNDHGREATDAEIGEALGLPAERVVGLLAVVATRSLDAPLSTDPNSASLHEFIVADGPTVAESAETLGDHQALLVALNDLRAIERDVLLRRFGMNGDGEESLLTIGNRYRLTRERIRQIEVTALKKLRGCLQRSASPLSEIAA